MKDLRDISDIRLCGFYELKKLIGLGDENLKMLLEVGGVPPINFNGTARYSMGAVRTALLRLEGRDIAYEYEVMQSLKESEAQLSDASKKIIHKIDERSERRRMRAGER
jgi:hypothetical protein